MKKIILPIVALTWSASMATGAIYNFFPEAYAAVAYHSSVLPITEKVKKAAPSMWYRYQSARLNSASKSLSQSRRRMQQNRSEIEAKREQYQSQLDRSEQLLNAAKGIYSDQAGTNSYQFIGKRYTPGTFSAQVIVLNEQVNATRASLQALQKAGLKLDQVWSRVAKKEAQLSADKTRLATAQTMWDTQKLLSSFDMEFDLEGLDEITQTNEFELRTVEELLSDASHIRQRHDAAATPEKQLSNEALAILNR